MNFIRKFRTLWAIIIILIASGLGFYFYRLHVLKNSSAKPSFTEGLLDGSGLTISPSTKTTLSLQCFNTPAVEQTKNFVVGCTTMYRTTNVAAPEVMIGKTNFSSDDPRTLKVLAQMSASIFYKTATSSPTSCQDMTVGTLGGTKTVSALCTIGDITIAVTTYKANGLRPLWVTGTSKDGTMLKKTINELIVPKSISSASIHTSLLSFFAEKAYAGGGGGGGGGGGAGGTGGTSGADTGSTLGDPCWCGCSVPCNDTTYIPPQPPDPVPTYPTYFNYPTYQDYPIYPDYPFCDMLPWWCDGSGNITVNLPTPGAGGGGGGGNNSGGGGNESYQSYETYESYPSGCGPGTLNNQCGPAESTAATGAVDASSIMLSATPKTTTQGGNVSIFFVLGSPTTQCSLRATPYVTNDTPANQALRNADATSISNILTATTTTKTDANDPYNGPGYPQGRLLSRALDLPDQVTLDGKARGKKSVAITYSTIFQMSCDHWNTMKSQAVIVTNEKER